MLASETIWLYTYFVYSYFLYLNLSDNLISQKKKSKNTKREQKRCGFVWATDILVYNLSTNTESITKLRKIC